MARLCYSLGSRWKRGLNFVFEINILQLGRRVECWEQGCGAWHDMRSRDKVWLGSLELISNEYLLQYAR